MLSTHFQRELGALSGQVRALSTQNNLTPLIDRFQADVEKHMSSAEKQAVFATAW
jgi:hypothetical protein